MMRSLFAGVSGLKGHQVKMDVIGNNIANINTVGFKAGRVTFQESLTQMLRDASRANGGIGGINPFQVGLGSSVSSVDINFAQGNLESTGNTTDLAIEGNAFFIVSNNQSEYYTRAGNFVMDGEGRMVTPANGYVVQGMLADSSGEIIQGSAVEDIVLPFGQKSPANATTTIEYSCNLDSDSQGIAQLWAADIGTYATVTGSATPTSLTIDATNDTLTIEVDDDMGSTISKTITLTQQTYTSVSALVAEINTQISKYNELNGEVIAEIEDIGGGVEAVQIRTVDTGGTSTELTLSGNACANMNLSTSKVTGVDTTMELNDLLLVSNDLNDGDQIIITGVNPDGTTVNTAFTYGAANDGTTVGDLIDQMNVAYSGSVASLSVDGNIELVDSIVGDTNTTVTFTFKDVDASGSAITLPTFISERTGRDAGSHLASITVYDSMGATHLVSVEFTCLSTATSPNIWSWEATIDEGEIIPSAGNKGNVSFNSDGSLAVFTVTDGQPLTFDSGGGADTMRIDLDAGETGTFGGITQLNSPTTTVAKHQDGYGMGNLQTISIDSSGSIRGHFSNGVSQTLAQIALATFNNPAGLVRSGDNLYEASANSGTAVKGGIGRGITASISSGALEMSNVDLAQEFTDMIVAQRGFQANARVITTADTLLNEVVQLKR